MANSYLTNNMITFEMLRVLSNNVIAASKVTRTYDKQFAKTGAKIGQVIQVRKPPRYFVSDGATFVAQDYAEEMVPLTVDQHKQVGCEFGNDDLTLNMDDFSGRVLKPSLVPLANAVDSFIMADYYNIYNATGTPGTTAATDTPFLLARNILFNNAAFMTDDMPMLLTGRSSVLLSSGLSNRLNPAQEISELYRKGGMGGEMKKSMGHALGWNMYEDQNMPVHVTGAWALNASNATVTTAGQIGASILTTGWAATITGLGKKGDSIQFAGVYSVNPVSYASTGELMNFALTADVNSDGSYNATLPITPPIVVAGKGQNVSNSPAAGAIITVWDTAVVANVASKTSPQNMGWQNEAITLACVDLMVPEEGEGVKAIRVADDDLGLSFVYMRGFDPRVYSRVARIDILFGKQFLRPEHVVRVAN